MTRILIVDHDKTFVSAVEQYLSQRGFEIIKCLNGLDVVKMLKSKDACDLIVIKYTLPDIDADVILEAMEILSIKIPVILMGGTETLRLHRIPEAVYLLKPVDLNNLLEKIN